MKRSSLLKRVRKICQKSFIRLTIGASAVKLLTVVIYKSLCVCHEKQNKYETIRKDLLRIKLIYYRRYF